MCSSRPFNLQAAISTLNMPVALPDVLVGHDKYVYMRSQTFDLEGNRVEFEAGNRLYYTATDGTLTALH